MSFRWFLRLRFHGLTVDIFFCSFIEVPFIEAFDFDGGISAIWMWSDHSLQLWRKKGLSKFCLVSCHQHLCCDQHNVDALAQVSPGVGIPGWESWLWRHSEFMDVQESWSRNNSKGRSWWPLQWGYGSHGTTGRATRFSWEMEVTGSNSTYSAFIRRFACPPDFLERCFWESTQLTTKLKIHSTYWAQNLLATCNCNTSFYAKEYRYHLIAT